MNRDPFNVVVRRLDGTVETVFSHPDLSAAAKRAFLLADAIGDGRETSGTSPAAEVAIERSGRLELSIVVSPGHPLYSKKG